MSSALLTVRPAHPPILAPLAGPDTRTSMEFAIPTVNPLAKIALTANLRPVLLLVGADIPLTLLQAVVSLIFLATLDRPAPHAP